MTLEVMVSRRTRKAAEQIKQKLVPETDTGGRGEYPQARERTPVKELCKILL